MTDAEDVPGKANKGKEGNKKKQGIKGQPSMQPVDPGKEQQTTTTGHDGGEGGMMLRHKERARSRAQGLFGAKSFGNNVSV